MEREIKFRYWDHTTKYMAEVRLLKYETTLAAVEYWDEKGDSYTMWNTKGVDQYLMQYTGLKDKNGKEIYEGDCLDGIYAKGSIEWCTKCGGFMYIGNENGCLGCTRDLCPIDVVEDAHKYEIIGNIYENPELLT